MANLHHAATAIRTDTAGVKGEADKVKNAATAEVPFVSAAFHDVASSLHLTGGPHPESVPELLSSALAKATDAVRGPHGGTVAPDTSTTAPGPTGGVNATSGGVGTVVQHARRLFTKKT